MRLANVLTPADRADLALNLALAEASAYRDVAAARFALRGDRHRDPAERRAAKAALRSARSLARSLRGGAR